MPKKLSHDEILKALTQLPGWSVENEAIHKTFQFETYGEGLLFAVVVGHLANSLDHHPDMMIGYRKVDISISTHSESGVTHLDITLAGNIEAVAVKKS